MAHTVKNGLRVNTKLGRFVFIQQLRLIVEPLVIEGTCLECGSVTSSTSPAFLPHKPICPGLRRVAQTDALLKEFFR